MADRPLPQIRGTLRPAPLKDQAGVAALLCRRDPLFVRGMCCWFSHWILLEFSPPPHPDTATVTLHLHRGNPLVHGEHHNFVTNGQISPPASLVLSLPRQDLVGLGAQGAGPGDPQLPPSCRGPGLALAIG